CARKWAGYGLDSW
nr:immunoglobulin heavy chain junction region [Macaca mulatta]MOW82062.1 immunoglobulin heavy chain junction region [Macaca mulatta]MOX60705.1 immunoglobulin heavy chain junction region [Macaca mulatta]MOX62403.1 immunoglobulin heavy chain junction region [Macaca mulatta]MOX62485.1 immunoglobulin heavy chain junction region [Macaca mulatta]